MTDKVNLTEEELSKVNGGVKENDPWIEVSYICPICQQVHTCTFNFNGLVNHGNYYQYNVCSQTKYVTYDSRFYPSKLRIKHTDGTTLYCYSWDINKSYD